MVSLDLRKDIVVDGDQEYFGSVTLELFVLRTDRGATGFQSPSEQSHVWWDSRTAPPIYIDLRTFKMHPTWICWPLRSGAVSIARTTRLCFYEQDEVATSLPVDNWDQLLHEIEIRSMLEEVEIFGNPQSDNKSTPALH